MIVLGMLKLHHYHLRFVVEIHQHKLNMRVSHGHVNEGNSRFLILERRDEHVGFPKKSHELYSLQMGGEVYEDKE